MWNKSKKRDNKKSMVDKLTESLSEPMKQLTQGKEISELKQILESYHAHFEKMLEVQAKILNVLEITNKMKGVFDEEYYYKEKGFEKADKNKFKGNTITADRIREEES